MVRAMETDGEVLERIGEKKTLLNSVISYTEKQIGVVIF